MNLLSIIANFETVPVNEKFRKSVIAQGRVRLFVGGSVVLILTLSFWLMGRISNEFILTSIGYILFCIAGVSLPKLLDQHRLLTFSYVATVLDPLAFLSCGLLLDQYAIIILGFYLFTIMGYGIRLGYRHLLACHLASLATLVILILASGHFLEQWPIWLSYTLTLVGVPAYAGVLIRRLHASQRSLETLATRDPLTGLPNRRLLQERLTKAITLAARINCDVALLYFDLDGFKKVNDTYGHPVGDKLLQTVAAEVLKVIRDSDTFARIAGDEFVVVLEGGHGDTGALVVAQQILTRLKAITMIDDQLIAISASIGISLLSELKRRHNVVDADGLIEDADQALYQAKRGGKNQYCIAGDAMSASPIP